MAKRSATDLGASDGHNVEAAQLEVVKSPKRGAFAIRLEERAESRSGQALKGRGER
jgi:hypothetical protein